ncbi:hypothetical protein [Streptomyces sp. NPDC101455]|uniref:hypothetical protein n=1 Tax=Streptomyces sp. NPDC101455 TaxID=3366142 RepID=UPI0037F5E50F
MNAEGLIPVSSFEDAHFKVRAAAGAMIPLVAETVHAQFPTGRYLVLNRSAHEENYDELSRHSVRDATGETEGGRRCAARLRVTSCRTGGTRHHLGRIRPPVLQP